MVESKDSSIEPLPRPINTIIPLPYHFTPNVYKNSKIFIMNPVFDIIDNEDTLKLEMCIICLEYTIEAERIKPCETCNTYMHEKCFIKYSKSKQNKPSCVTCYKEINLDNIDIVIEEEIEEETEEERTNRIYEEGLDNYRNFKKYLCIMCSCCVAFCILILIIIGMQRDYAIMRENEYYKKTGYNKP
tara:strand:- start:153 stop:713 length:561 start_codon:yes stop_codon:yes gene_type:complete